MFVRTSTIHAQTSKIDSGIAYVNHTVMPAMSHIPGYVGLSVLTDRETGRCIATSGWRDEIAMRASDDQATPIRDAAAAAFGGLVEVDEWEVAVMHRAHHARQGTCMRVVWSKSDPARADELVERFKFQSLAKIEDLPGFCSASLMLNDAGGRAVVSVAYDDRETLDLSREAATKIRGEVVDEFAIEVLEVAEFDLAIAHLHIPEIV